MDDENNLKIKELYKDNQIMFCKYQEFYIKCNIKDEIIEELKKELKNLENQKLKLENENKILIKKEYNISKTQIIEDKYNKNKEIKKSYLNKDNNYRCTIIKYDKDNISISKNAAIKETFNEIFYYYELYKSINDEKENIDNIISYITYNRNLKSISDRKIYKSKIERCYYIYNIYGNKLNNLYFNLSSMSRIYDDKWKDWLIYLDSFIYTDQYDDK